MSVIQTLLVANRGEIACRIIRTARSIGMRTVAVHSDVDAGAMHVEMADAAVSLGGATAAESYLDGGRIIAAAQASGAQAIHPGYGFLSENPDFVEAVEAAGLIFVGPSAHAIRAMGLKDAAKRLMVEAGVPVVPGYHGADQDPATLARAADEIGYPVLIKAVAGGGGKGMRLVERPGAFAEALGAARREAEGAFGNGAVLVEKFIQSPRHIEVQVFGDSHGNAVHLYERDCSLQRRHQKVIEEAPAPGMTVAVRAAMGTAAVRAAQAIGYAGAGTVEFIVDGSGPLRPDGFWFMEMNTRLQVEHPVTEEVTGIDLVAWQLAVAAGAPLPMTQEQVPLRGHAFEARLYAEDVGAGFLPATGRLSHLRFPAEARIESGVREGDSISPFYDPMIAKVVTHGATRAEALGLLSRALEATEVAGTVTNIGFLARLSRHRGFADGRVDTGLIQRDLADLLPADMPEAAVVARAALTAAGLDGDLPGDAGFALWQPQPRTIGLTWGDTLLEVALTVQAPDRVAASIDGATVLLRRRWGRWQVENAAQVRGAVRTTGPQGTDVTVFAQDHWRFGVPDPLARGGAAGAGGDTVEAPMPGLVKAVLVTVGAEVTQGTPLAILEAMKMEHVLTAPRDGTIAELLTAEGAQVEAGVALIRLEDAP